MMKNPSFYSGAWGCFTSLIIILLAIFAMAISTNYQYPESRLCGGMLGAGYPVLFICDHWGGGSPTNSWGKITFIDVPNGGIRPTGFLIDFLFYSVLVWFIWFSGTRLLGKRVKRSDVWWSLFIMLGFLAGFLCASLTFWSSSLYLGDRYHYASPTPIVPSATPVGTMPSEITPTLGP
jgi:hypothetical protein